MEVVCFYSQMMSLSKVLIMVFKSLLHFLNVNLIISEGLFEIRFTCICKT